jgi:hypothetical protein
MLAIIIMTIIVGMIFVVACHSMEGFDKSIKGAGKQPRKINRKPRML